MNKIEVIGEAGVNHCGNLNKALQMVDVAQAAGADVVKFQTFEAGKLVRREDPQFRILGRLALQRPDFIKLAKRCEQVGIEFLSTPGDVDSLKFLVEEIGVKRIKIGSDDLTYRPLTEAAYKTGLPVIMSTGMATETEIVHAVAPHWTRTTLLHCVSAYPCKIEDANLEAITTLRYTFDKARVGYSDHCAGTLACIAAAAMDAIMIEKHFVLDGSSGNEPDAAVSIWPNQLARMINDIRAIEKMLGSGIKEPCEAEKANAKLFRKGPDGLRPYKEKAA